MINGTAKRLDRIERLKFGANVQVYYPLTEVSQTISVMHDDGSYVDFTSLRQVEKYLRYLTKVSKSK